MIAKLGSTPGSDPVEAEEMTRNVGTVAFTGKTARTVLESHHGSDERPYYESWFRYSKKLAMYRAMKC